MSAVLEQSGNVAPIRPLSVTLSMDEGTRLQMQMSAGLVEIAEACVIDSADMATVANGELRNVIAFKKELVERRKKFVEPAKAIIAEAEGLFGPSILAAERAEGIYKQRLLGWSAQEEERVARERREHEEAQRRARAEAEAKAAAERARAEEAARKAREDARIAEEARQRAEAEARLAREQGDKKGAAEAERRAQAAAAERARREEEERRVQEEAQRRASEALLGAAAANHMPAEIKQAAAPAGFGTRENWVGELAPGKDEDAAKLDIAKAIAGGRLDLLPLLKLDMSAVSRLAKAQKKQFNVPGLVARNNPVATSRAK